MRPVKSLIVLIILASCATPPLALDVYKLRLKEVFKKYAAVASLKSSSSTSPFSFGGSVTPVSAASSSPASSSAVSAEKARKDSDYKALRESSKGSLEAINAVQSDLNSITPSVGLEEKHKAIKQMFESIKSYQEEINGLPTLRSELKAALDNGRINNLKTKQAASLKATLEGSKALDDIGILGESSFSGGVDQSRLALLLVDPKKLEKELDTSAQSAVNSLVELGRDPLPPVTPPVPVSPASGPSSASSAGGDLTVTLPGGVQMRFKSISAGTFTMGSPTSEPYRNSGEVQHSVTLTQGFSLQTTEVTQVQWKAVMGNNPSNFKGDDLPVERVSWDDAQNFITALNALGQGTYRLPTEAEWEYAARAGSTTAFANGEITQPTGNDNDPVLDVIGWYGENSGGSTHPVAQKQANAWGLYDMHGNVWEWVQDWSGDYPSGSVTDPPGPSGGSDRLTKWAGSEDYSARVLRGGSWNYGAINCRSAYRSGDAPSYRSNDLGFRLLRSAP